MAAPRRASPKTAMPVEIPGKWSGSELRIEGEDLLIMKESDVLGIIQGGQRGTEGRLIASEPSPFRDRRPRWPPNS